MATTSRTFTLSIAGVQTAINDMGQLRGTVQQLEQQLDTAQFGTDQFDRLQTELLAARKAVTALDQATQTTAQGADKAGATAKKMGGNFQGAFNIASLAAGDTGDALGKLEGGFGSVSGGLGKLKDGFGTLKGAIASTGILLIAFGALVSYFTKSQEGMEFLDRKTKALQAVFQLLTNKAIELGKFLFETFSNPKKAITDLVDVIETNLTNRLKAFGVILEGIINQDFGKVTDGFIQMGTGIENATAKAKAFGSSIKQFGVEASNSAAQAEKIAVSNQKIAREERALNVERANSRSQIAQLKLISDDATKSLKVRQEATRAAFAIETGLINKSISLQDRAIVNLKAEQALKKNLTAQDFDALAELQTKRADTRKESLEKQAELTAKLSGFVQQQKATELAAITARKAAQEKASTELKALKEKDIADTSAAAAATLDVVKRGLDAELAAAEKGSAQQLGVLKRQKQLETDLTLQAIDDKLAKAGVKEKAALIIQRQTVVNAGNAAQTKVETDFEADRRAHAAQDEATLAAVKVLGLKQGSKAYYAALVQQVSAEEFLALNKLEKTKDNEAERTRVIQEAKGKRDAILKESSLTLNDLGGDILTKLFGVSQDNVDKVKQAINDAANYALQTTLTLLAQASQARMQALDAQTKEADDVLSAARAAADALSSQLDESQTRIDDLESKLLGARGVERQRIIDQLSVERTRNAQLFADKAREDTRSKKAEQDKVAIEKQRTAEQDKQARIQNSINAIMAIGAAISATKAATDSITAIASAGAGGKFGFDNIAYILAATAGIVAAGIAVKSAVTGFDQGGFTGGGFGSADESGYKVAGVVHEHEYVVPKWMVTSPKFSSTIAQLESARVSGGAGFAVGGYAPVSVSGAPGGVDMSILFTMQQSILTLQAQTTDALNKPSYVRPTDIKLYEAQKTVVTDYFVK